MQQIWIEALFYIAVCFVVRVCKQSSTKEKNVNPFVYEDLPILDSPVLNLMFIKDNQLTLDSVSADWFRNFVPNTPKKE